MSLYDPGAAGYDISGFTGISSDPYISAYANDPTLGTGYSPGLDYSGMYGGAYNPAMSGYDALTGSLVGGAAPATGETPQAAFEPVQTQQIAADPQQQLPAAGDQQQPGQPGQPGGARTLQQLAQDQQLQRLRNQPVSPQGWAPTGGQWTPQQPATFQERFQGIQQPPQQGMPQAIQQAGEAGAGARTGPAGWDPLTGQPTTPQQPTEQAQQQPGAADQVAGPGAPSGQQIAAGGIPLPRPRAFTPEETSAMQQLGIQGATGYGPQERVAAPTQQQQQPTRPDGQPAGPTGTTDDAKTPQERRQQQVQDRRAAPQPRTPMEQLVARALNQMGLPSGLAGLVTQLLGAAGGMRFPGRRSPFGPMGRIRHGRWGYGRGIGGRHGRGMQGFNWYGRRYGDGPPRRGFNFSMGLGDGDGDTDEQTEQRQQEQAEPEHADNGTTQAPEAAGGQPAAGQFTPGTALPAGPATPGRGQPFTFGPGANPPAPATPPAGNQVAGPGVPSGVEEGANTRTPQEREELGRVQEALQAGARGAAAPAAAPQRGEDFLMSAASPGYAAQSLVPAGNNVLSRIQQARQAVANAPQITPQLVARSRPAGTTTQPTQGYSNYLRNERSRFAQELRNPRSRAALAAMMATEDAADPIGPAESLMNRASMTGQSLQQMLSPRFYGPMRTGAWQRAFRQYAANPNAIPPRINAAIDMVLNGSNVLGGATDQGNLTDPNGRWQGGRVMRGREVYNDWGGYRGHQYSRMWRERQQRQVQAELAGQQQLATGTQ